MSDRAKYILTLQDNGKPTDAPPGRRLAMLLKIALRGMGMKCLDVKEEPSPTSNVGSQNVSGDAVEGDRVGKFPTAANTQPDS